MAVTRIKRYHIIGGEGAAMKVAPLTLWNMFVDFRNGAYMDDLAKNYGFDESIVEDVIRLATKAAEEVAHAEDEYV